MGVDHSYCVPFPFFLFCLFPAFFFFVMVKPLVSLPFFSRFAEASSPFLQLAICSFSESSKKSKEQKEEAPPQEADTGFPSFPLFFFFILSFFFFFFLELSLSPFFFYKS